jgi:hypothetical protein
MFFFPSTYRFVNVNDHLGLNGLVKPEQLFFPKGRLFFQQIINKILIITDLGEGFVFLAMRRLSINFGHPSKSTKSSLYFLDSMPSDELLGDHSRAWKTFCSCFGG